ncbi:MAG: two-component regulator propeller domain-containing protein, partial [Rhodothermaceae bacterium]
RFEHLSLDEGLSQSFVSHIIQDKEGFIWIATQDGLNKFDGYKFTTYRHEQNNKQSLSYNYLYTVFEDSDGYLWIGSDKGGLNRFDKKSKKFIHFKVDYQNPKSILANTVRTICEDKSGNLWVGTYDGLSKLPEKYRKTKYDSAQNINPEFENFLPDSNENKIASGKIINSLLCDKSGNIWIGSFNGLSYIKANSVNRKPIFVNFYHDPKNLKSISHNVIRHNAIYEDSKGNIWIGTVNGLNKYNPSTGGFSQIEALKNTPINAILEENENVFWIGSDEKLIKYNLETKELQTFVNNPKEHRTLSFNDISCITGDRGGNIWIGTYGGGINKLNSGYNRFKHYKVDLPDSRVSQNNIWEIFEDSKNNLWIGTDGSGAVCYNKKTGKQQHFIKGKDKSKSIAGNIVYSFFEDSAGNIWIGTKYGLSKLTFKNQIPQIRNIFSDGTPNSLSRNNVRKISQDKKNNLWFGTWGGGINKLSAENNRLNQFKFDLTYSHKKGAPGLSNNFVRSMLEASDGTLWITTYWGLNILKKSNPKNPDNFVKIFNDPQNPGSLTNNSMFLIHEDADKNIWVGTRNGINKLSAEQRKNLNPETVTFQHFRETGGLANEIIYGLLEDSHKNIWVSTNQGISRIDYETEKITNYLQEDGLQSNEYNVGAYFKSNDGSMYFGGINGYTKFHPDSIKRYSYSPSVCFTDFLLYNKSVKVDENSVITQHINFTKEITLNYEDHIFAIEFSALNFRQPKNVKYAYKLEGLHKKWVETDYLNRRATFTDLASGDYTFKVKACNDDGVWSKKTTELKITILPPLWFTWWAKIIYLIILGYCIYFFYSFEKKKYQQKQRELYLEKSLSVKLEEYSKTLEQKVEERTHELKEAKIQAEQANDLKTELLGIAAHDLKNPLNVILGFSNLIQDDIPENSESKEYLEAIKKSSDDMLDIISKLLDSAAIETGEIKLELESVSLNHLLQSVINEYNPLAANKNQRLKVTFPSEIIYINADAGRIKEVISNIVSNAVKYSPRNSDITINYFSDKNQANIDVSDQGPGISKTDRQKLFQKFQKLSSVPTGGESSTGLGLSIAKKLIELHSGNIKVETEQGKGSTFSIILPVERIEEITGENSFSPVEKIDFMKQKVIIADDLRENRKLISQILKKHNLTILEVANGEELLKMALQVNPDFIFCDINMPIMNGFEAVKKLKEDQLLKNIPVASVTSLKTDEVKKAAFDEFIFKPVNGKILIQVLKKYLDYKTIEKNIPDQKSEPTDLLSNFKKLNKSEIANFASKLKKAETTKIIDDVLIMTEYLINVSDKTQQDQLNHFAKNLEKSCKSIDIVNIDKSLNQLSELVDKI